MSGSRHRFISLGVKSFNEEETRRERQAIEDKLLPVNPQLPYSAAYLKAERFKYRQASLEVTGYAHWLKISGHYVRLDRYTEVKDGKSMTAIVMEALGWKRGRSED